MSKQKTLVLAKNFGAYFYLWANSAHVNILLPELALYAQPGFLEQFDKIILINGIEPQWLFHARWMREPRLDTYFFIWDPARCPLYAPPPDTIELIKIWHKVYSFQQEDCECFGLQFNSTMYALPPPGLIPEGHDVVCDILFLGVPKDRLQLLRDLYKQLMVLGLSVYFRIGLTNAKEDIVPEQAPGWLITNEWLDYEIYLCMVLQSRCLLDLYQSIQTGFSLRVMEHIYFGKKLLTNNRAMKRADFYHSNNIFVLGENDMASLKEWLELPFMPVSNEIKEYYKIENWAGRFQ